MNLPRTFLVSALVAVFALQLSGCSLIFSRSASPEQEEGDRETGVPAWLALSHRINEEPALEDRDLPVQEEDEEEQNGRNDKQAGNVDDFHVRIFLVEWRSPGGNLHSVHPSSQRDERP